MVRGRVFIAALALSLLPIGTPQAHAREDRPWVVASDTAVVSRTLSFENRGATLMGTLFRPAGLRPLPTLIALHGAGVPLRSDPLYRHLTEVMPRLGMAVFLYDRRGSGHSTSGGAAPGNFELLADDAVAAFAMLSREPGVDPAKIGFWGLSQGGWLTLLAAAKEQRAAFAIAVSAPMAAADVQMNFAVSNILRIRGHPQAVIDRAVRARTIVDDFARGRRSRAEAQAAETEVRSAPWYDQIWLKGNLDDPEWRQQITADPLRSLEGSKVPTLVVFGQADPWVPVATSLSSLKARSARLRQVTTRVIDDADHAMMLDVPPTQQIDTTFATQAAPNAPAYFALLGAWLQTIIGMPDDKAGAAPR